MRAKGREQHTPGIEPFGGFRPRPRVWAWVMLALIGCKGPSSEELTGSFATPNAQGETPDALITCEGNVITPTPEPAPGTCANPTITSLSPQVGRPGSTVRIRGKGFGNSQGLGKVTFNAIEALPFFEGLEARPGNDMISWSDTEIVVKVPERAANEPDVPAAVVVSCGDVDQREFGKIQVPIVLYRDSNAAYFDIRRPGSDLDMGFWVFRMGTFGNEHSFTDDPISPCNLAAQRCRFQPLRQCDRNDLDLGKYGMSSSQCAGLGIPWGGQAYNGGRITGVDINGDGKLDRPGGILDNADYFGLLPERNRDLETGNFPETLLLYGEDVELSDSSGFVGIRRVRDHHGQIRYGVTCSFCHSNDDLGILPSLLPNVAPKVTEQTDEAAALASQAITATPSGSPGVTPSAGPSEPAQESPGVASEVNVAAIPGPEHREGGADVLGPDPNNPMPPPGEGFEPSLTLRLQLRLKKFIGELVPFEEGQANPDIHQLPSARSRPQAREPETNPRKEAGPDSQNPAPPGAPRLQRATFLQPQETGPVALKQQPAEGVDPHNPAPPGAPMMDRSRLNLGPNPVPQNAAGPAPGGHPGGGKPGPTSAKAPAGGMMAAGTSSNAGGSGSFGVKGYVPKAGGASAPGAPAASSYGSADPAYGNAVPPTTALSNPIGEGNPAIDAAPAYPGLAPTVDSSISGATLQRAASAAPPPLGTSSYQDTRGYTPGHREPGPVEGGIANRQLKVGLILANSKLVAILDEIDPLPGGMTRRKLLSDQEAGRMDFNGFPRISHDTGFESAVIPHHLATTGFTRMLYSDRVDRSPLAEVQRRITQQAHFDMRNVGALLNARSYSGLVARGAQTVDAMRVLAVYLNATNNPDRIRRLMQLYNEQSGVDAALVKRGKELFACHGCVKCHSPHLGRYTSLAAIPLKHIGTDPRHALARGNGLEGEGEFIPQPVWEAPLQVPLAGLKYILEINRILAPRVDKDRRDDFKPLVVQLNPSAGLPDRGTVTIGDGKDQDLKVIPRMTGSNVSVQLSDSRLLLWGSELNLEVAGQTVVLKDFQLKGVIHPDGSTWGAPLQDNRASMLVGDVVRSSHPELPVGTRLEAYISGVRSDLFAGIRPRPSLETLGYRVPKLVALRFKVGYFHDGSLKKLEDLMDDERIKRAYRPTGFDGIAPGYEGVPGHTFTLLDSAEERAALLAFLRSL